MGNWYSDLYGEEAFEAMVYEYTREGPRDVNVMGEKFRIRIIQQDDALIIDLYDRATGEGSDRIIPVGGFTRDQRLGIAHQALKFAEAGLPIMWKEIISPMIGGYWEDEEWDVIAVHNIDRSKIDPAYRRFLK